MPLDDVTVKLTPALFAEMVKKPGLVKAPEYVRRILDDAVTALLATTTVPAANVAVPMTGRAAARLSNAPCTVTGCVGQLLGTVGV